jgi:hypothetical protein
MKKFDFMPNLSIDSLSHTQQRREKHKNKTTTTTTNNNKIEA